jgi:hypothetical protein
MLKIQSTAIYHAATWTRTALVSIRSTSSIRSVQTLKPTFTKNNNPRPGKEATQPQSTDGKQNELNDGQNTEKETKLVKNRIKITTEDTESTEEMHSSLKCNINIAYPFPTS